MPQPIDPQTELGRLTAAERIQQIADRASLAAQARASQTALSELTAAESQVRQMAAKGEEVERELSRPRALCGQAQKEEGRPGPGWFAEQVLLRRMNGRKWRKILKTMIWM